MLENSSGTRAGGQAAGGVDEQDPRSCGEAEELAQHGQLAPAGGGQHREERLDVVRVDFQDPIVAALADYDFRVVFGRVRAHTGWSQQTLANLVGLDQARISAIERGASRLRDVALVAQVATALWIPPVLLGFGDPGTTVGQAGVDGRKLVSWMDRRDFFQHVTALTVGVTGAAGLDIDRLIALLPHADPTGTRHLSAADVAAIEQATAA